MTTFAELVIKVDSTQADPAKAKMDGMTDSSRKLEDQVNKTAEATAKAANEQRNLAQASSGIAQVAGQTANALAGEAKSAADVAEQSRRAADAQKQFAAAANQARQAALEAEVASGKLVKTINPVNGVVSFVPVLAKDAKAATGAVDELADVTRKAANSNDDAAKSAAGHARAVGQVSDAIGGAVGQTLSWKGALLELVGGFSALAATQIVLDQIVSAYQEAVKRNEDFQSALENSNRILATSSTQLAETRAEVLKLADAYKQMQLEQAKAQVAKNNQVIQTLRTPSRAEAAAGGVAGILGGPVVGGAVSGALAGRRQAQIDQLETENARLMARQIELRLGDTRAQEESQKLVDAALPKERQVRDLKAQEAAILQRINSGLIDRATGERAITALQARQKEIEEGHTRTRAAHAAKSAQTAAVIDRTDELTAQAAGQVEQAMAGELRARMALTDSVEERAEIEKDLVLKATAAKQAQVDKQIAQINDPANTLGVEDPAMRAALKAALTAQLRKVQAINASAAVEEMEAIDRKATQQLVRDTLAAEQARRSNTIDVMQAQAALLKSTYAQAVAQQDILAAKQDAERYALQEVVRLGELGGYTDQQVQTAKDRLEALKQIHSAETEEAKRAASLSEAIRAATDNVRDFKDAFKRRDFGRLLDSLAATIQTIQAAFQSQGLFGGIATGASALGSLIGGKAGKAVGNVAGGALLGLAGGNFVADAAFALGPTGIGGTGLLGAGAVNFLAGPLAAALPWVGLIAGLASLFLGKKPSNHAGITQLTLDSFTPISSGKETPETTQAVSGASQAILQGEALIKAAGVQINAFVTGLDLGTRDMTHIFLSTGEELRSAVGDPAAAAETALKAVLQSATYTDQALKGLIDSALAAGKGFDAIATILQAQQIGKQLADQILQLQDPQAYEAKQVKTNIEQQRDAAKALFDQGALTADQLATINGQLSTLEGLQLADVMKRFSDAASGAASAAQDLKEWLASLAGVTASPAQTTAQAYSALQAAGIAARSGDSDAASQIPDLGNAYLAAAKASASSQIDYLQAVARARAIGSSALLVAEGKAPATSATTAATSTTGATTSSPTAAPQMPAPTNAGSVNDNSDLLAELRALRAEVASLRGVNEAGFTTVSANTGRTAKQLEDWDGQGLPPEREDAA